MQTVGIPFWRNHKVTRWHVGFWTLLISCVLVYCMILYVSIIPYFDLVVLIYTYLIISIPIVAVSERSTWCHGGLHCCGFLPHFGVKFPVWCPVLFAGQIPRSGCDLMLLTSTCSRVCVSEKPCIYIIIHICIYIYTPHEYWSFNGKKHETSWLVQIIKICDWHTNPPHFLLIVILTSLPRIQTEASQGGSES